MLCFCKSKNLNLVTLQYHTVQSQWALAVICFWFHIVKYPRRQPNYGPKLAPNIGFCAIPACEAVWLWVLWQARVRDYGINLSTFMYNSTLKLSLNWSCIVERTSFREVHSWLVIWRCRARFSVHIAYFKMADSTYLWDSEWTVRPGYPAVQLRMSSHQWGLRFVQGLQTAGTWQTGLAPPNIFQCPFF